MVLFSHQSRANWSRNDNFDEEEDDSKQDESKTNHYDYMNRMQQEYVNESAIQR